MHIFFQPLITRGIDYLDEDESRHCIKVLRLGFGRIIHIVDGQGGFYKVRITDPDPKNCRFTIIETTNQIADKDYYIHVLLAPTKSLDKTEWFLEKSIELGIDEVSFITCEHSERKKINLERLQKKAISAMKQSLRAVLPQINDLTQYAHAIFKQDQFDEKYIALYDSKPTISLFKTALPQKKYCILIGPEGGFSPTEIDLANNNGFKTVSLGKSRLRTETAALAACHILNIINLG